MEERVEEYTVSLVRWIDAKRPDIAAQEFLDDATDDSWIVQVDDQDGVRRYFDTVPNGLQRGPPGTNLPALVSTSRLRICPACEGKVEIA